MNKNIASNLWWILGFLAFFALMGFLIWRQAKPQDPAMGEPIPNLGRNHINIDATHETYNSNPPTSGAHYAQAAPWGVYDSELPDEQLIHNLEHGGIWISYKDVDVDTKSVLENIAKQNPGSVVLTPRAKNDAKIALASWERLMKFESLDESAIRAFIKANKNKSPEPLAR